MLACGEKLLAWRRHRGLTQAALARAAGIPQPNIAALEAGKCDPRLSTLNRLAHALEVSSGTLIDHYPAAVRWTRRRIDALVQAATREKPLPRALDPRLAKALRVVAGNKLAAAGVKISMRGRTGVRLQKQIRADLGPDVWKAVVRRLDKYCGQLGNEMERKSKRQARSRR